MRAGFPISPKRINDVFDALLYDLYTILSQDIATLGVDSKYYKALEQLSNIEGRLTQASNKEIDYIQNEHTDNWRHL